MLISSIAIVGYRTSIGILCDVFLAGTPSGLVSVVEPAAKS